MIECVRDYQKEESFDDQNRMLHANLKCGFASLFSLSCNNPIILSNT